MLKGHPHHNSAYLLLGWYFVWKQRYKSFISHMGCRLAITRSLSAAGCCAPPRPPQPSSSLGPPDSSPLCCLHILCAGSCHLAWEVPRGMEAALLPFPGEREKHGLKGPMLLTHCLSPACTPHLCTWPCALALFLCLSNVVHKEMLLLRVGKAYS